MKFVNVFYADQLADRLNNVTAKVDGRWVAARPIGYIGFFHRVRCAWEVFRGRADILKWYKQ